MSTADPLIETYERRYGPFIHMAPLDKSVWVRYLMQGGAQFAPFTYDLRVGNGLKMPAGSDSITLRTAYALTTKRIDVLCFVDQRPRIIEVKQRAGLSAVGQLIGYRDLYNRQFPEQPIPEMFLVTDVLQPDMRPVLLESNISYYEVGL